MKLPYDLILCDFDGTLARSDKTVSAKTRKVIRLYREAGGVFILATGRSTNGILSQLEKTGLDGLDLPIVSYQGAHVETAVSHRVLSDYPLDRSVACEVVEYCLSNDIFVQTYDDNGSVIAAHAHPSLDGYCGLNGIPYRRVRDLPAFVSAHDTHKVLMWLPPERFEAVQSSFCARFGARAQVCRSSRHFLECFDLRAGKGGALKLLADRLGIDRARTAAFGDQQNDLDMILAAGHGFAVANAAESLLKAADEIAPSNNDDGVGKTIAQNLGLSWEEL